MPGPIISLTTDFGSLSGYSGTVKGVLLSINPTTTIVDISHEVPPQDIAHGAFVLGSAYRYFDRTTIHVAVVDPGVGTSRHALLLITPSGQFLAPDNGLLTYVVLDQAGDAKPLRSDLGFMEPAKLVLPEGCEAYSLTKEKYWKHPVSRTFHGRDIFASVAAHLSLGTSPHELGEPLDNIVVLKAWSGSIDGKHIKGSVIFVDGFGNLVTNLRSNQVPTGQVSVEISGEVLQGIAGTFSEADELMALHGSHGYLEVAARDGSAATRLQAGVGDIVRVLALEEPEDAD